jgi:dTMP kinase
VHETGAAVTPLWVSLEGINGVGKTHLAHALTERLAGRARLVSELTDGGGDKVIAAVVAALSTDRTFLRTGHPLTETMALLALKVREHELVAALPDPPQVVIEDHGVDTVAVYQAAIATPPDGTGLEQAMRDTADAVYATAAEWRPLPDLTVLLVDDPAAFERRFAEREGRPVAPDERRIIDRAARLYRWRARVEPGRIRVVDRAARPGMAAILAAVEDLVRDAAGARR